ncbi:MAG: flippase [Lachnospiraceae bacterium]|nr:flippase [Lachnospiraceae bacterium]
MSRSLYENSLYYMFYRIINVIYPLITATYVSRILQPDGVGQISYVQTIVIFLAAVACLGTPNYGTREISKCRNRRETSIIFSELFIINFIASGMISIFYYAYVFCFLRADNVGRIIYIIIGFILLLNIINVDWFYQGKEEFKYITIRSFVVKVIAIMLIFALVHTKTDIYKYACIFTLAYVGNYGFNIIHIHSFVDFIYKGIDPWRHVKNILTLAVTYISNEIYVTVDIVMLGSICGNSMVGYYSNAMKLVKILVNVCTAMGVALLPRLSRIRYMEKSSELNNLVQKAGKILFWFTVPCAIGILLTARELMVVLFGYAFEPATYIIMILGWLVVIRSFSNLSLQVLLCFDKDIITTVVYFAGMILNIILNVVLIPIYQGVGAALASVVSECVIFAGLYLSRKKQIKIVADRKLIMSTVISNVCMVVFISVAKKIFFQPFSLLVSEVLIGVITYIGVGLITQNEVLAIFISKFKKMMKI